MASRGWRRAPARHLGLPETDRVLVERAALVHDIGALGVSTGIWDKRRAAGRSAERERVRTHPYLTERVLAQPAPLAAIGAVASMHHERLDGSGYPRGVNGRQHPDHGARSSPPPTSSTRWARTESHRPRLPAEGAGGDPARGGPPRPSRRRGRERGAHGRGSRGAPAPRASGRADATARSRCSRCWCAACRTSRSPRDLGITPRTVGSHVEHIYSKIGVSTRGAAAVVRDGARTGKCAGSTRRRVNDRCAATGRAGR